MAGTWPSGRCGQTKGILAPKWGQWAGPAAGVAAAGLYAIALLLTAGCSKNGDGPRIPGLAAQTDGSPAAGAAPAGATPPAAAEAGQANGPAGTTSGFGTTLDPQTATAALAAFNRGAALLEQYQYDKAANAFELVLQSVPNWTAAQFNLALAYFNMEGKGGSLDKARSLCETILARDPQNRWANFLLGMYYQHLGKADRAAEFYGRVHQADPEDVYAQYKYAEALSSMGRNDEAIALLQQVVNRDPGFASGHYRLFQLYQRANQRDKAMPILERFKELNERELDGKQFTVGNQYGSAGKYYRALGPEGLPLPPPAPVESRIVFSPAVEKLPLPLEAWSSAAGPVRLPGIAAGDLDGDGDLDLVVCGSGTNGGAAVLLNDGKGHFSQAQEVVQHAVVPSLGDVDNDGDLDLWLGQAGPDSLWLNDGKGHFDKAKLPADSQTQLTSCARLVDLDCDGDLDLLSLRLAKGSVPVTPEVRPAPTLLWNNNRDGTFAETAAKWSIALPDKALAAVVYEDFDNDRDLDLVLFAANAPPVVWVNDRVGRFHLVEGPSAGLPLPGAVGAITADFNKDGLPDLVVLASSQTHLFVNRGKWQFEADQDFAARFGKLGGTSAQWADLDNDGDLDLLIADARRRDGTRGPVLLVNRWPQPTLADCTELDPGNLLASLSTREDAACLVADFDGDGQCDVLLAEMGGPPKLIRNATAAGHWVALELSGTEERGKKSRSNRSAIGARVEVKAGTLAQQYLVGASAGATAMPPARLHVGLAAHPTVEWLRILWPDAVLQAEMDLAAGRLHRITEIERKPSSCPHLFAWTGTQFAFVSDFGGMGGLGYLVAPDRFAQPDPTEYVRLPPLEPRRGFYVLQVIEPLEEVVYFDEAKLLAVDHPEGTEVFANEMAAVGLPPPAFELFCVGERIEPVRAVDHRGQDVTDALRRVDRHYAGATQPDPRFAGFAEQHAVEMEFGPRLARLEPAQRGVLFLNGWVEYAYSSTNYAAAQAGLRLEAPSLDVWRDGQWVELFHEAGYPAGLQHWMTLDLGGKLRPGEHRLRIRSNMEIYWDCAFVAPVATLPAPQEVPAASADLHFFGYPREYSPDGRRPNLYDYSNRDRLVPWKVMPGYYTRFGEVTELVRRADDCYVIMGSGEELTLRFAAGAFGPVPPGYRRTFILKTDSFCKDMDHYTACGDAVEPLPFHAMRSYPYGADEHFPDTAATRHWRQTYNTRYRP